jgi:hypothetical protein
MKNRDSKFDPPATLARPARIATPRPQRLRVAMRAGESVAGVVATAGREFENRRPYGVPAGVAVAPGTMAVATSVLRVLRARRCAACASSMAGVIVAVGVTGAFDASSSGEQAAPRKVQAASKTGMAILFIGKSKPDL